MGEAIAFWILSALIVVAALGVVTLRNLFHCALCLGLVLFGVSGRRKRRWQTGLPKGQGNGPV